MHYTQYYSSEQGAVNFLTPSFLLEGKETQKAISLQHKERNYRKAVESLRFLSLFCYGSSP